MYSITKTFKDQTCGWNNLYNFCLIFFSHSLKMCIKISTSIKLIKLNNAPTFHATRESSPVGKDHEWQLFAVEVVDGLGRLVGRVGEPHLSGLLDRLGLRVQIGRVGRDDGLHGTGFYAHHTDGLATQAGATGDHSLGPRRHDLWTGGRVIVMNRVATDM